MKLWQENTLYIADGPFVQGIHLWSVSPVDFAIKVPEIQSEWPVKWDDTMVLSAMFCTGNRRFHFLGESFTVKRILTVKLIQISMLFTIF